MLKGKLIIWSNYRQKIQKWIFGVTDFNFLNVEVEEFSNGWRLYLVNVRSPSYLKQKTLEYCL